MQPVSIFSAKYLAAILVVFLSANVYAQETYYTDNGRGLIQSVRGNPDEVKAKEWQVRLYKLGEATSGNHNWGLITGKSAVAVMNQLKESQDFQKRYAKWSGFDYTRETFTFFNPLGPIAVVEEPKPRSAKLVTQIGDGIDAINRLREGYKKIEQILTDKPQTANPYRNVGNVLREYAKNLSNAETRLADLQNKLRAEYNYTGALESALQEFSNSLSKSQSSYDLVKTEIDRSMPRSGGGSWMTDEFTYTTTDSKGNIFEEIQKYDISATGGILRIKQEITTKESIGLVFRQRQTLPGSRAITTQVVPLSVLNANSIKHDEMTTDPSWRVEVRVKEPAEARIQTESYVVTVEGQTPNQSAPEQTLRLLFGTQSVAQQAANDLRKLISGGSPASPSAKSTGSAALAEQLQRAPENARQNQANNQSPRSKSGIARQQAIRRVNKNRRSASKAGETSAATKSTPPDQYAGLNNPVRISEPEPTPAPTPKKIEISPEVTKLIKEGDDAFEEGRINKAAIAYTKAWEGDPSSTEIGFKAAELWIARLNNPFEGARILDRIGSNSSNPVDGSKAQERLALIKPTIVAEYSKQISNVAALKKDGKYQDAVVLLVPLASVYEKFVMTPNSATGPKTAQELHLRLAHLHSLLKNTDSAVSEFGKALKLAPIDVESLLGSEYIDLLLFEPKFLEFVREAFGEKESKRILDASDREVVLGELGKLLNNYEKRFSSSHEGKGYDSAAALDDIKKRIQRPSSAYEITKYYSNSISVRVTDVKDCRFTLTTQHGTDNGNAKPDSIQINLMEVAEITPGYGYSDGYKTHGTTFGMRIPGDKNPQIPTEFMFSIKNAIRVCRRQ